MQLTQEFHFEAAHKLDIYPIDHPNARMHGHSFRVCITLEGQPNLKTGQIMDLSQFRVILDTLQSQLDHRILNNIEGLKIPTLENICLWLWSHLQSDLPHLKIVEVHRDSLGESCRYEGV